MMLVVMMLVLMRASTINAATTARPNILFFLADDMGASPHDRLDMQDSKMYVLSFSLQYPVAIVTPTNTSLSLWCTMSCASSSQGMGMLATWLLLVRTGSF